MRGMSLKEKEIGTVLKPCSPPPSTHPSIYPRFSLSHKRSTPFPAAPVFLTVRAGKDGGRGGGGEGGRGTDEEGMLL